MRVGLIGRADRTGLAAQTWSFWRNMNPAATLVVDLRHCSGQPLEIERYAGDPNVTVWTPHSYPSMAVVPEQKVEDFLNQVDVVFSAETFYSPWLITRAREKGVRTCLQPNVEFLDHMLLTDVPEPDCFALPTSWLEEPLRRKLPGRDIIHLPVPVDRELLPFRHRPQLRTILHTAGAPTTEDRNGTQLLIEAMHLVKSPVRLRVRIFRPIDQRQLPSNVEILNGTENYWDLYGDEDLYVMPRKYGGLCLPQQEALSVGMPVLMTDCEPQNRVLPPELLLPTRQSHEIMTKLMIGVHETSPAVIASRIDWLYENPYTFGDLSRWADGWAEAHSWSALRPLYDLVLAG